MAALMGLGSDFDASAFDYDWGDVDLGGLGGAEGLGEFNWEGVDPWDLGGPEGVGEYDWTDVDLSGLGGTEGLGGPGSGPVLNPLSWLDRVVPFASRFLPKAIGGTGEYLPDAKEAARMLPGLLALQYARQQNGIDTSGLESTMAMADVNAPLFVQGAINPVQQNIARGYGDLVQSQAARGIRGSSFGDADIANYLSLTGRALGDVGATAAQRALGLRGDLAGNIAALKAKSQELKNNLYGRAFDVLGRGLNPGGYAGTTNITMGGGGGRGAAPAKDDGLFGTGISAGEAGVIASIASMFSDRRLKSNIVKVADDPRGFGWYEFDMFGSRHRGVMADEVEKVVPEAVLRIGEMRVVDYGRLNG